jgi:hypothetical protein
VSCDLDIKTGYSLTYESGAIENPVVNRRIVDVLEGTMVAFDNRKKKYLREFFADFPFSDS